MVGERTPKNTTVNAANDDAYGVTNGDLQAAA